VDGKKKSVADINAEAAEQGRQESNENQEAFKEKAEKQETMEEQDIRRPRAVSNLQAEGQESERNVTPMDVDGVEVNSEVVETEVKRNPDGSICEDCN
jgi:hypothetical protein